MRPKHCSDRIALIYFLFQKDQWWKRKRLKTWVCVRFRGILYQSASNIAEYVTEVFSLIYRLPQLKIKNKKWKESFLVIILYVEVGYYSCHEFLMVLLSLTTFFCRWRRYIEQTTTLDNEEIYEIWVKKTLYFTLDVATNQKNTVVEIFLW